MSAVVLRPVTPNDPALARLIAELRAEDAMEIVYGSGRSPDAIVRQSVLLTPEALIAETVEGDPIAVFGCTPVDPSLGGWGLPWMLGTRRMDTHKRDVLALSRSFVALWQAQHAFLFNRVWEGNTSHIRYLKALGFSFDEPQEVRGENFIPFYWKRPDV